LIRESADSAIVRDLIHDMIRSGLVVVDD
jgi:hypothetical protein